VIVLPSRGRTKEKEFVFVDGGVTMYNNPAFQMFLMATAACRSLTASAARTSVSAQLRPQSAPQLATAAEHPSYA